jgi:tRNA G18 (ribose-2'-O)-methylase SpoU
VVALVSQGRATTQVGNGIAVTEISDPADPRITDFVSLTDMQLRQRSEPEAGIFIAEGFLVLEKLLALESPVVSILAEHRRWPRLSQLLESRTASRPDVASTTIEVMLADGAILERITGYRVHRGLLASVRRPEPRSIEDVVASSGHLIALEGLVDPTNVGLAFRSAAAMGFTGVILSPDCADPLYRRAVRTSMGAVVTLPWARSQAWPGDLRDLRDDGFDVIALSPDAGGIELSEFIRSRRHLRTRVIAVFGAEGDGLSDAVVDAAAMRVRIPMDAGIDSLNIAATVAVVGYAMR